MLKVMIAEDDFFMADLLGEYLGDNGYEVCGIASTVEEAVELGERHKPDLAVLDMRLAAGGRGTDVAAWLKRQGGPGILYATGNIRNIGPTTLTKDNGEACLGKPFRPEDLVRALKIVEQLVSTGEASRPFPEGFSVLEPSTPIEPSPSLGHAGGSSDVQRLLLQQAALAKFGRFALGRNTLEEVLAEAVRACAEGLGAPFSKLCRYRAEENDFFIEAGFGWQEGVIGRAVPKTDETSPFGRAFITERPVICDNLNKDATFEVPGYYAQHGIASTLDVIVKNPNGQAYGVLEIDSASQRDFDRHDVNFVADFAGLLAEAIGASKRNSALQSSVDRVKEVAADKERLLAAKHTALNEKSLQLIEKNRLLAETGVLAQELQHRVRNNLQLVYGMLHKQLDTLTDGPQKEGFSAIARRVMTLAKVYDHLLGAGLSRTIDFGGYLWSLCSSFEALQGAHSGVSLTCQCEALTLDLDTVTTLGLVVAELISNSYLHGFPDGKGTISLSLSKAEPANEATIVFADDGVGFSPANDGKRQGVGLVKRLMQQIRGTAELCSDKGTMWILKFPAPPQRIEKSDPVAQAMNGFPMKVAARS
jgi:two-component sensor histidine kinase/ActR/RegA family two-component response regulator